MRANSGRTFSLELKPVDSVRRVSVPNENLGGLLIEENLGELESLLIVEGKLLKRADEYAYSTGKQFNVNALPIVAEKVKLGVEIHTILPQNIVLPPGFQPASGPERSYF